MWYYETVAITLASTRSRPLVPPVVIYHGPCHGFDFHRASALFADMIFVLLRYNLGQDLRQSVRLGRQISGAPYARPNLPVQPDLHLPARLCCEDCTVACAVCAAGNARTHVNLTRNASFATLQFHAAESVFASVISRRLLT